MACESLDCELRGPRRTQFAATGRKDCEPSSALPVLQCHRPSLQPTQLKQQRQELGRLCGGLPLATSAPCNQIWRARSCRSISPSSIFLSSCAAPTTTTIPESVAAASTAQDAVKRKNRQSCKQKGKTLES